MLLGGFFGVSHTLNVYTSLLLQHFVLARILGTREPPADGLLYLRIS